MGEPQDNPSVIVDFTIMLEVDFRVNREPVSLSLL